MLRLVQLLERRVHADQSATEDFLQHGGRHSDDADASRDVQAEDRPDEPELRRLQGFVKTHVTRGDRRMGLRLSAVGLPTCGWQPIAEGPGNHVDEVAGS